MDETTSIIQSLWDILIAAAAAVRDGLSEVMNVPLFFTAIVVGYVAYLVFSKTSNLIVRIAGLAFVAGSFYVMLLSFSIVRQAENGRVLALFLGAVAALVLSVKLLKKGALWANIVALVIIIGLAGAVLTLMTPFLGGLPLDTGPVIEGIAEFWRAVANAAAA